MLPLEPFNLLPIKIHSDSHTVVHLGFRFSKQRLNSIPRNPRQLLFEFDFKLGFDGLKPKHPERAVFSFRQVSGVVGLTKCVNRVLGNLRDKAGLGVGGVASQSQSKSRLRTIEHCTGLFVVQVRGGLNDCAVTRLHIHMKNREVSIEWKHLFGHFFREKRFTDAISRNAPVIFPFSDTLIDSNHRTDSNRSAIPRRTKKAQSGLRNEPFQETINLYSPFMLTI